MGYTVLCKNFRTRWGEIDIIAEKNTKIYFFEVKTRQSLKAGLPAEAVTYYKKQHLQQAAWIFLQKHRLTDRDYFFRILSVKISSNKKIV